VAGRYSLRRKSDMTTRTATVSRCLLALMTSGAALAAGPEQAVEAPGPLAPLRGSLLGAERTGTPLMLIVPGSGPTDRDGNGPLGLKASSYRLLAEGLAAQGIATVRIDKRGMFGSAAAVPDANAVTVDDYASDVRAWVQALRRRTSAACVWVLGHSEGGLVAMVAGRRDPDICGLVLVATAGRPLGQVLREQFKANPANAPILDAALGTIAALEAGRRVDTSALHPALQAIFNPQVQGFLISTFALDPAQLMAGIDKPVLILQGERDLQVGVADARRLQQAAPAARLVLLPDTNHVLKAVGSADWGANVSTYGQPGLPLAPGVIDAIAGFVRSSTPPR
jgi:pimeloyl-ACP methyl ester carboxylesterase